MRGFDEHDLKNEEHFKKMVEIVDLGNNFTKDFRNHIKNLMDKKFDKNYIDTFIDMILLDMLDLYINIHGEDFEKIIKWMKYKYNKKLTIKLHNHS